MAKEKRTHPRRHLIYYLKVVHPATEQLIGRLVDITPIGMMLMTPQPLETGVEMPVRLILPTHGGETHHLDLVGETVWCHKDVNPDYYAVGFRFQAPAQEAVILIQDLIETLGFKDGGD